MIQRIIKTASEYFQLGALHPDLVLLWEIDGEETEVTNDILGLLPGGTNLTLSRTQRGGEAFRRSWHSLAAQSAKSWKTEDHVYSGDPFAARLASCGLPSDTPKPTGMFVFVRT